MSPRVAAGLSARLGRRVADRRGQGGFTLVEALITVAISAIIAVPVLAWMLTGFKADLVIRSNSERTGLTTRITQTLPRDLASASGVRYTTADGAMPTGAPIDCAGVDPAEELTLSVIGGDGTTMTAYAVSRTGNLTTLIRRECPVGGAVSSSETLGESRQNNGPVVVTSTARRGGAYGSGIVSGVDVVVQVPATKAITVSGSLRGGLDP